MSDDISIGPDTTVEELVDQYPRSVGFLLEEGVICLKCGEPVWGTCGELIARSGLDVESTIARLQQFLRDSS